MKLCHLAQIGAVNMGFALGYPHRTIVFVYLDILLTIVLKVN